MIQNVENIMISLWKS